MERTSSRLVRREQNKVAKQTIWIILITSVLLLGFMFVVLPGFINIINSVFNTNPFPEEEAVLLQAPLIDAPEPATKNQETTITGYSPTGKEVVLILNNQQSSSVTADDEGKFSMAIKLIPGTNTVAFFAKDESGNESPTSKPFTIIFDQDAPSLTIESPAENASFDKKTQFIYVKGSTDTGSTVYINGRMLTPDTEGVFSTSVPLNDGENEITIQSTDEAGNSTEKKIKVIRTS